MNRTPQPGDIVRILDDAAGTKSQGQLLCVLRRVGAIAYFCGSLDGAPLTSGKSEELFLLAELEVVCEAG